MMLNNTNFALECINNPIEHQYQLIDHSSYQIIENDITKYICDQNTNLNTSLQIQQSQLLIEYNTFIVSIYEKKGRTACLILSNNSPRRIFKRRYIQVIVPPLLDTITIICSLSLLQGNTNFRGCNLENYREFTIHPSNKPENIQFILVPYKKQNNPKITVEYNITISFLNKRTNQKKQLHSFDFLIDNSHKFESNKKGETQNRQNIDPIKIKI